MPFHIVPDSPSPPTGPELDSDRLSTTAPTIAEAPFDVLEHQSILNSQAWKMTPPNKFGLYKRFWTLEKHPHDPDFYTSGGDLQDDQEDVLEEGTAAQPSLPANRYHPFPNASSFWLGQWYWDEWEKSRESFQQLLAILTNDQFNPQDLLAANWKTIQESLASSQFDDVVKDVDGENIWVDDGRSWQTASISLDVPFHSQCVEPGSRLYSVEGFRYRPLVSVIRAKLEERNGGDHFHIVPCDLRWQRQGSGESIRVYGESYHSPAFLDAYKEVQVSVSVSDSQVAHF